MNSEQPTLILNLSPAAGEQQPVLPRMTRARALAFLGFFRPLWGSAQVVVEDLTIASTARDIFTRGNGAVPPAHDVMMLLRTLMLPANLRRAWQAAPRAWTIPLTRVFGATMVTAEDLDVHLRLEKYNVYDRRGVLHETYATLQDLRNILQRVSHNGREMFTLEAPLLQQLRAASGVDAVIDPTVVTLPPGQSLSRVTRQSLDGYMLLKVDPEDKRLVDTIVTVPAIRRIVALVEGNRFLVREADAPYLNGLLRERGLYIMNLKQKQS